jgi:hypothetical protein
VAQADVDYRMLSQGKPPLGVEEVSKVGYEFIFSFTKLARREELVDLRAILGGHVIKDDGQG